MKRVQKKAKEPEYYVARVIRTDGSNQLVKFYDSLFEPEGVSLMLIRGRKFCVGTLGVGEMFIPWNNVSSIECWTAKEFPNI